MRKVALLFSLVLSVALIGCDGPPPKLPDDKKDETASTTGGDPVAVEEETIPDDAMPKITDLKVGTGETAATGDSVWVLYKGSLTNGTEFDSNRKPEGAPYHVKLGDKGSIPGFERAIAGMKVGGLRKSEVPSLLGYGKKGNGSIPPNSDLVFEIELLHVVKKGHENEYGSKDLKVGTGQEAKKGDRVSVHYVGTLLNGKQFDSSAKQGKPLDFTLGEGGVIQGWDYGIVGMKVGGKRKLVIPPDLGYGVQGQGDIPPSAVLVFEVELVGILK